MNVIPPRQRRRRESTLESAGIAKEIGNKIYHRRCLAMRYIGWRLELNLYTSRALENLALEGACDIQAGFDIVNI